MATIILEGPNGAGKSTLAKDLSKVLGYDISHSIPADSIETSIDLAWQEVEIVVSSKRVILDRVHAISCPIYNKPNYEQNQEFKSASKIIANNGLLIHCIGAGEHDTDKPHYTEELKQQCKKEKDLIKLRYISSMLFLKHVTYNFKLKNDFKRILQLISIMI